MEKNTIKCSSNIPCKFDSRFVFSDTLIRTSRLISNEKTVENMIMATQLPYVFTEEPIPLEFDFNLSEGLIKESYSKFSWLLENKDIPSPILISFQLTENTIEKTVFVIFEIEFVKRNLIPEKYCEKINKAFPKICREMIENMDKELKEDYKDIYHYDSKLLNFPRKKIWNIIVNYPLIMEKAGVIKNLSFESPMKEGSEISFNMKEDNKFFKLKITKFKCEENDKKWELCVTPLKGPFDHFIQEWTLIELDANQTFLMNNSKYKEHIKPDIFKKITEQKKFTFQKIEELLKTDDEKSIGNIFNEFFKNVENCGNLK